MVNTSLADRVGGMLMIGFDGTAIHEAPTDFIAGLSGTILFQRNLCDAVQSRALVDGLQAARHSGSPPLLVAVDQEGGSVSRIRPFGTPTPSAMALGASGDPNLTESIYGLIGEELATLGINLDIAPVADVIGDRRNTVIGIRSFGAQPEFVGQHVAAAIRGLHGTNVASAVKHFPGHGDTAVDSHFDLPVIGRDADALRAVALAPFRAAVAAGVDAVMIAHAVYPSLDPTNAPATFSRVVITGLLREELGYDGIVCTDCMQMKAVPTDGPPGMAAVRAVAAGADLVVFSSSLEEAKAAHAALRGAVLDGTLDEKQIERSLGRIDAARRAVHVRAADPAALERIGSSAHRAAAREASLRGITIVRDPQQLVPLRAAAGQRIMLVHFSGGAATQAEHTPQSTSTLGAALSAGPARIHEQVRGVDPAGHEYKQLLMAAGTATEIVCVTYRAAMHPLQARAVADLVLFGKPVIVVMAREPYDIDVLPAEASVIAAFGDDESTMSAVGDVLLGRAQPGGQQPATFADARS
ncbi:MAG TPA: glycoside hydrolase family 3 N-terminal domain-containing protein [Candidatus Eremiobacteraceae bacterium]